MIRPARPEDAEAMHALAVRAWMRNFADIVDASVMLAAADEQGPDAYRRSIADPGRDVLVYEAGGRVAGHVFVAGDEVRALYVDPPAQGAGVGSALLAAAEERIRSNGHDAAFLWTLAENGLARAMYERRGWSVDSETVLRDGDWAPTVRYRKEL